MQETNTFNSVINVQFNGNLHTFDLKEHTDAIRLSTVDELARESLGRCQSYCFAVVKEKLDETHSFTRIYDGISFFECANWIGTTIEPKKYMTPLRTEVVDYVFFEINPRNFTSFELSRDETSGIEKKLLFWKLFEQAYFPPGDQRYWEFATRLARTVIKDVSPEIPLTDKQIIKANIDNLGYVILRLAEDTAPLAKPRLEYYSRMWKAVSQEAAEKA